MTRRTTHRIQGLDDSHPLLLLSFETEICDVAERSLPLSVAVTVTVAEPVAEPAVNAVTSPVDGATDPSEGLESVHAKLTPEEGQGLGEHDIAEVRIWTWPVVRFAKLGSTTSENRNGRGTSAEMEMELVATCPKESVTVSSAE
jgi:hypothetical protein